MNDGSLGAGAFVTKKVLYEFQGDREKYRMEEAYDKSRVSPRSRPNDIGPPDDDPESEAWWEKHTALEDTPRVWPKNRVAFGRILEALRSCLPVREVKIDPYLTGERDP